MLKVTLKLLFYCVIGGMCGCKENTNRAALFVGQRQQDSLSEARIDSAYAAIRMNCDSLLRNLVPFWVDSLLKDSTLTFSTPGISNKYSDADKKVESIIGQLLADCDTSLQRETYRKVRLLKPIKPKRRNKY